MTGAQRDQPMSVRATAARWALGSLLAVGALVLLLKPGGVTKLLGLVLAVAAVTTFTRRSRSASATSATHAVSNAVVTAPSKSDPSAT